MNKNKSLKQISRQLISFITYYSGACFLLDKLYAKNSVRILCYHGVNQSPTNQYSIATSDFASQVKFLKKNYKIISIDQLATLLAENQPIPPKTIAISFDDGFEDFYCCAFPILKRFNIPATSFIPTGFVDDSVGLRNTKKLPQNDFLSWNQIREMSQSGIDFGSHTVSHNSLRKLSRKEIQYELAYSKTRLESELGKPIKGFAFPYGTFRDISPAIEPLIAELGFSWAVTSISGVNKFFSNPYRLHRTVIQKEDQLAGLKRAVKGSLDGWLVMQKLGFIIKK